MQSYSSKTNTSYGLAKAKVPYTTAGLKYVVKLA